MDKALAMWEEMREAGFVMDAKMYSALLHVLQSAGRIEEVGSILTWCQCYCSSY